MADFDPSEGDVSKFDIGGDPLSVGTVPSGSSSKGSKPPKSGKPKTKGSPEQYIHGSSGSCSDQEQTSAAISSKNNPFGFLSWRSDHTRALVLSTSAINAIKDKHDSQPLILDASLVDAINNQGDSRTLVVPNVATNTSNEESAARQEGFLSGYEYGWNVGCDALKCPGGYAIFGTVGDPCHGSLWGSVLFVLSLVGGFVLVMAGIAHNSGSLSADRRRTMKQRGRRQEKSLLYQGPKNGL